jgi:hypothetical protein
VIPPLAAFQGRMSGRHLKLRVFILPYLRPFRQAEVGPSNKAIFTLGQCIPAFDHLLQKPRVVKCPVRGLLKRAP